MDIKWLRAADRAVDEIAAYIAEDDPGAAARTLLKIAEAVNMISEHPSIGRAGRVPGTRELVVPNTPYIVAYRVRGNTVQILLVLHAARRWPTSF